MSNEMQMRYSDTKKAYVQGDALSGSLLSVDFNEHLVHNGQSYQIRNHAALTNAATLELVVTTPDTDIRCHARFIVSSTDQFELDFYEGPTTISGGTPITPLNQNRASTNSATHTVLQDPTSIGDDGDLLAAEIHGAVNQSGSVDRDQEFVLAQNTKYLYRITNGSNANDITYFLSVQEQTPRYTP